DVQPMNLMAAASQVDRHLTGAASRVEHRICQFEVVQVSRERGLDRADVPRRRICGEVGLVPLTAGAVHVFTIRRAGAARKYSAGAPAPVAAAASPAAEPDSVTPSGRPGPAGAPRNVAPQKSLPAAAAPPASGWKRRRCTCRARRIIGRMSISTLPITNSQVPA